METYMETQYFLLRISRYTSQPGKPLLCFGRKRIIEKINLIVLQIYFLHMYTRNITETERKFISRSFLNLSHMYMLLIVFILYFGLGQEMETVSYQLTNLLYLLEFSAIFGIFIRIHVFSSWTLASFTVFQGGCCRVQVRRFLQPNRTRFL